MFQTRAIEDFNRLKKYFAIVKFWKLRVLTVLACPKSVCLSVFRLCRPAARGGQKRGPQNVGHRILLFFLNWPYSSNMRSERSSVRGGRPPLRPPAARVQAERSCCVPFVKRQHYTLH